MKPRHWLFLLLVLLTAARYLICTAYELTPDECYYYLWSQHPDWSYFSKGPGVAMTIRASTALFGPTALGVRLFAPLLALATSLLIFSFARRVYSEKVAVWTVLMLNCLPIFSVGSLVMTIDPLSIFFWAAAIYAFWMALSKSPLFSGWWLLTGLMIGLGFLAKYTNAMQLLSIVFILGTTRRYQREFLRPGFYAMLIVTLLCAVPVFIWNSQHAWITMDHLAARGGLNSRFTLHPGAFVSFLGAHCLVYSPLVFGGLIWSLYWAGQKARRQFRPRFLGAFALPLLVMYTVLAFKQPGEPNWTAPAFVSLGILGTALWMEKAAESRACRRFVFAAFAIALLLSAVTLNTDVARVLGLPVSYEKDPSTRLRGWELGTAAVQDFRKQFEQETGAPAFLIGNKYQTSSSLSFYLTDRRTEGPGHPPVYIPESQNIENEFSFWPRYDEFVAPKPGGPQPDTYDNEEPAVNPFVGRNALYITDRPEENLPSAIQRAFERIEMVRLFRIERRGLPLRDIRVFACYRYKTLPL